MKLAIARTHRDTEDLRSALGRFSESVGLLVERDGNLSPRAIDAQVALAAAQHESEPDGQALTDLEALHVTAQVVLGPKRREAIIAQATLAVAEFGAAGGWDGVDDERTRAAVETLEAAKNYATASLDLGRAHPQTRILQEALADMRAAGMTDGKAAYQIEKVYLPQDSGQRNAAKKAALQAENNVIRLIAHAGASYFLSQFDFYQPVIAALDRKVHFNVIISSPWSTLAAFLPSDPTADPGNYGNIEALVRKSPYYNDAYLKVTESYQRLKDRYPDHVELRVTPMDIAGSTLLTSDVGFFEPYTTSDPNGRTLRGMSAFEVMYRKDSQYYHDARKEFTTQWELSSTWGSSRKPSRVISRRCRPKCRHTATSTSGKRSEGEKCPFLDAAQHLHRADEERVGQSVERPELPLFTSVRLSHLDLTRVVKDLHSDLHMVIGGGIRVGDTDDASAQGVHSGLLRQLAAGCAGQRLADLEVPSGKSPSAMSEDVDPQPQQDPVPRTDDGLDPHTHVCRHLNPLAGPAGFASLIGIGSDEVLHVPGRQHQVGRTRRAVLKQAEEVTEPPFPALVDDDHFTVGIDEEVTACSRGIPVDAKGDTTLLGLLLAFFHHLLELLVPDREPITVVRTVIGLRHLIDLPDVRKPGVLLDQVKNTWRTGNVASGDHGPQFYAHSFMVLPYFFQKVENPLPVRRGTACPQLPVLLLIRRFQREREPGQPGQDTLHHLERSKTIGTENNSGWKATRQRRAQFFNELGQVSEECRFTSRNHNTLHAFLPQFRRNPECDRLGHGGNIMSGTEAERAAQVTSADRTKIHIGGALGETIPMSAPLGAEKVKRHHCGTDFPEFVVITLAGLAARTDALDSPTPRPAVLPECP